MTLTRSQEKTPNERVLSLKGNQNIIEFLRGLPNIGKFAPKPFERTLRHECSNIDCDCDCAAPQCHSNL